MMQDSPPPPPPTSVQLPLPTPSSSGPEPMPVDSGSSSAVDSSVSAASSSVSPASNSPPPAPAAAASAAASSSSTAPASAAPAPAPAASVFTVGLTDLYDDVVEQDVRDGLSASACLSDLVSITILRDPELFKANHGFAFIRYSSSAAAQKALAQRRIPVKGHHYHPLNADEKTDVFIGSLDKSAPRATAETALKEKAGNCLSVEIKVGFAFIAYSNFEEAVKGMSALKGVKIENRPVTIQLARSRPPVEPDAPKNTLYVSNLTNRTTEEMMRKHFQSYGNISKVFLVQTHHPDPGKNFCFVTYETEEVARKAMSDLSGSLLDGSKIVVDIARPPEPHRPRGDRERRVRSPPKRAERERSPRRRHSRSRSRSRSRDHHSRPSRDYPERRRSRSRSHSRRRSHSRDHRDPYGYPPYSAYGGVAYDEASGQVVMLSPQQYQLYAPPPPLPVAASPRDVRFRDARDARDDVRHGGAVPRGYY